MLAGTNAEELQERLRRAIAQRRSAINGSLRFGDLLLHPTSFTGSLEGKGLGLTLTEFKLLSFLVQHAGRPFTRTRLMHEAWGYDSKGRVRSVDVHVRRLRAKLGPHHQSIVDTVRGVGYMAATPPHPEWIVSELTLTPMWATASPPRIRSPIDAGITNSESTVPKGLQGSVSRRAGRPACARARPCLPGWRPESRDTCDRRTLRPPRVRDRGRVRRPA